MAFMASFCSGGGAFDYLLKPSRRIFPLDTIVRLDRQFGSDLGGSQRLQYPLIKEYSLNYSRIPNMI